MKSGILASIMLAATAVAGDLKPALGTQGQVLLEEKFEGAEVPKGWNANTGTLRVHQGQLMAAEKASDKHIGAFRYRLPLQDCAIQFDLRLGEARTFNVGFDPQAGELKKKGHLYSVIITRNLWSIVEHNDKTDPASKPKVLAKGETKFDSAQTYTFLLESKGNDVVVQCAGKEALRATSGDFHVKKPGLVFRMGGKDGQEVALDNVKVWALK
ncbi:MAG TPA: hypothetical protein VD994_01330 [Prosthecobacter sp.]|nr:hypothetical protein [Prosthecobacter sp.]